MSPVEPVPYYRQLVRWVGQFWARAAYGHFVEPWWLEVRRIDVPLAGIPQALDGLRILHLTDLHGSRRVPVTLLREAIDRAAAEHCDLVALTGDYIHHGFRFVEPLARLLGRLQAPLGVYAVLGNHDWSIHRRGGRPKYPLLPAHITDALTAHGITVLHNRARQLTFRNARFVVAGIADAWSGHARVDEALDGVRSDLPRIVLTHNPMIVESLENRRCDLMLAGHTHGGQVHVPHWGPVALPTRLRRYAAGLMAHNTGYLYVNKGIGYTVPFRFGVRPEVAVLTLREGTARDSPVVPTVNANLPEEVDHGLAT